MNQPRNPLAHPDSRRAWLDGFAERELARLLPRHISAERMARVAFGEFARNEALRECSPDSVALCLVTASQLGLEPSSPLGHVYLIPRKGECTLLIGYKGLLDLMRRSGEVARADAAVVYEGEDFEVVRGSDPKITHKPSMKVARTDDKIVAAYCVVVTKDGGTYFDFVTRSEIEDRRKRGASGMGRKSPWDTDYAGMARKSAIRKLLMGGMVPMRAELAEAMERDLDEHDFRNAMPESSRAGGSARPTDYLNVEPEPAPSIPERAGFADEGPARESAPAESAPADDGEMP